MGPVFLAQRALLDNAVTAEAFTNGLRGLARKDGAKDGRKHG
ncbi:MAG: hypothetical protein ABIZ05_05325 [Pseudonocardiaceae bacterium]